MQADKRTTTIKKTTTDNESKTTYFTVIFSKKQSRSSDGKWNISVMEMVFNAKARRTPIWNLYEKVWDFDPGEFPIPWF